MKISKEARTAAANYARDNIRMIGLPERYLRGECDDSLVQAMQSLINSTLERARQAVMAEKLIGPTKHESDFAYDTAIGHAAAAILALKEGTQ